MYQTSWRYDLQFLIYRVWQTEIGKYRSFFALLSPLKTKKIGIKKNWKKLLEISSFYTSVPKTTIIWGTVPETWSEAERIFSHFGSFFAFLLPQQLRKSNFRKNKKGIWRCHNFTHVYQKSRSYDICFLRYGVRET